MITFSHVSAAYGDTLVLNDLSLHIERGEMVALVGPNGAGKSSLLRVVTGALPASGTVLLNGAPVKSIPARRRARLIAVVPQEVVRDIPFSAHDFVLLGRTARLPRFGGPSAADQKAVKNAMGLTETWELRQRPLPEMSGGERQRLALAMALAADPEVVLLDEPTSHLDLRHRAEMMRLLIRLNRERRTTVLMVVHDLTLASQFFPRLILLGNGRKLAEGTPSDVLRPDTLQAAYGCPVSVVQIPDLSATCVLSKLDENAS